MASVLTFVLRSENKGRSHGEWPAELARLHEMQVNGKETNEAPKEAPLWFCNKIVQGEFNLETEEVKKEVEDYRQSLLGNIPNENSTDTEKVAIAKARVK